MAEATFSARRKILLVLAVLLVIGAVILGWRWYSHGRFVETTDNAYIEADISVVAPKVAGYIAQVAVADNQPVKRGDLLLTIQPDEFAARLNAAQTAIQVAEAMRVSAAADLQRQSAAITESAAAIDAARANWQRARDDLARYQQLAKSQFASVQRTQAAISEELQARAGLRQAEAALATARQQKAVLEARQSETDAAVAQARAQLAQVQVDLDATQVRAAIDGVIGNRSARPGQFVRAGTQVMAIVPVNALYVVANFKETQLARMHAGQQVDIEVDAYPDQPLKGRLTSLAPAAGSRFALLPAENATGNFTRVVARVPVRIALEGPLDPQMHLAPGMSVVANVDTRKAD
jgi:membrane fusion protein, multidrug efflux system